jgi:pterin-4a-carbinolamine dehydratase
MARPARLDAAAVGERLAALPGWALSADGLAITRQFRFADFPAAFAFMTQVALAAEQQHTPAWARRLRFSAITLGHVIVGQSHEALAALRAHERVHVQQYERLGLLFLVAYPGASVWALIRGRCPYRGNHFEQQAFAQAPAPTRAA